MSRYDYYNHFKRVLCAAGRIPATAEDYEELMAFLIEIAVNQP